MPQNLVSTYLPEGPHFKTLELRFHGNETEGLAILSVDCHPTKNRMLTTGIEGAVKLWDLMEPRLTNHLAVRKLDQKEFINSVRYVATLSREDKGETGCNVARFSPAGKLIASIYTDGELCIWKPAPAGEAPPSSAGDGGSFDQEYWKIHYSVRIHRELTDLAWSPDSRFVVVGTIDGGVLMYDVQAQRSIQRAMLADAHEQKVQGVVWDPWNEFVASTGVDKKLKFYTIEASKKKKKSSVTGTAEAAEIGLYEANSVGTSKNAKGRYKFKGELASPFFRRMSWSPDGSLLAVPCAVFQEDDDTKAKSGAFVFMRNDLTTPAAIFGNEKKSAVIGCKFAPCVLNNKNSEDSQQGAKEDDPNQPGKYRTCTSWGPSEYQYALAMWSRDSVEIFSSESQGAIYSFENLHYELISDVSWNSDATKLFISSHDAYLTVISFPNGLLGQKYELLRTAAEALKAAAPPTLAAPETAGEQKEPTPDAQEGDAVPPPEGSEAAVAAAECNKKVEDGDAKQEEQPVVAPAPVPLSCPVSVGVSEKLKPLILAAEAREKEIVAEVKAVTRGGVVRKKRRIEQPADGTAAAEGQTATAQPAEEAAPQQASDEALEAALDL